MAKMKVTVLNDDVAKVMPIRLHAEAQALPSAQREILLSLWPHIYGAIKHGCALLGDQRRGRVVLTGSIKEMCATGIAACDNAADEHINAARMNFQAARDLLALAATPAVHPKQWVKAGTNYGHAELRATLVLSGLHGVLVEGAVNAQSAQRLQAAREGGGTKRGEQMKAAAERWKAQALPYALDQDRKNPKWTRDRLATEISHQFEGEVPGHKAVTDWLKNEAEEPNGPIRCRSRKKSA
ncbi:hypothetical protein JIX59_16525 [Brevundimonas diminuta]|uniref:hypothetical protein n=1 Tax=Brevundimonas diminuta TaxID=293 RepID=UPI001907488E|nr:hypothetical protein [Brevundimonas diminuta]MBK1970948.1 hypothetical protein [Brevundimonas diminuta]